MILSNILNNSSLVFPWIMCLEGILYPQIHCCKWAVIAVWLLASIQEQVCCRGACGKACCSRVLLCSGGLQSYIRPPWREVAGSQRWNPQDVHQGPSAVCLVSPLGRRLCSPLLVILLVTMLVILLVWLWLLSCCQIPEYHLLCDHHTLKYKNVYLEAFETSIYYVILMVIEPDYFLWWP